VGPQNSGVPAIEATKPMKKRLTDRFLQAASASDREKLMSAVAAWRDLQFFESLESDALARYLAERPKQDHAH
jgi:hypothetical protein